MIDGWHNGLVSAIDYVHKPITIVLDQRGVPLGKGTFRRKEAHRHHELQQGNDESREQRPQQPKRAGHYMIIAARGLFVREGFGITESRIVSKGRECGECNEPAGA